MPLVDTINNLTKDFDAVKNYKKPSILAAQFFIFSAVYLLLSFYFLGVREGLMTKFSQPTFSLEITLLFLILISCLTSSILSFYPDFYQKYLLFELPYFLIISLFLFYLVNHFFFKNSADLETLKNNQQHSYHCSLCIALMAILPAIYYFNILSKGTTIKPRETGILTIISSCCLGLIFLRFSENNDDVIHIFTWHLLPSTFLAFFGAVIGAKILKW
jgi:hypothetical protein